jgi:hypothetical protein
MKTENKFKVEHGRVKRNWAHGHGIGLVVTESVKKPEIISQGRLAEIQELQIEYTEARNRVGDIQEQLAKRIKSVRDDLRKACL